MILVDDDTKKPLPTEGSGSSSSLNAGAGPSDANPSGLAGDTQPLLPAFEEIARDSTVLVNDLSDGDVFIPPGGEQPPPEFTPYEAEYFETSDGTVVSHDRHLNEDGEALYRFLLAHAQRPPQFLLHLHGDHVETHTRQVQRRDAQGRTRWHTETDTTTVVDFDFSIDISQHITAVPTHWSIPDTEPAHRGKMHQELDAPPLSGEGGAPGSGMGVGVGDVEMRGGGAVRARRTATRQEMKSVKAWNHERKARGLPPWIGPEAGWAVVIRPADALVHQTSANVLKSSKTVREWADEYCASPKLLKEFTYEKIVYGWNCAALEAAIIAAIQSTYYTGNLTVKFIRRSNKIHVRADNWLSRALSHTWVIVLLWITLLYPFIWLFKRFAAEGGGKWQVCGGAYALKAWQFVGPPPPGQSSGGGAPPVYSATDPSVVQTDKGAARLVGVKEGEWFAQWEGTIKRAVSGKLQTRMPLVQPSSTPSGAAIMLDGYRQRLDSL